jgi:predicted nucleic acid-binding protein
VRVAYVDTSFLLAIAFGESNSDACIRIFEAYDTPVTANLTEAEFRAALHREGVEGADRVLHRLDWLLPNRPLGSEIERVLRVQYLRGADLWHVACALFLAERPRELDFLTLDENQLGAARALGFHVPQPGQ